MWTSATELHVRVASGSAQQLRATWDASIVTSLIPLHDAGCEHDTHDLG